jgi:hypothetical protein
MKYFLSIFVFALISCKSTQQTTSNIELNDPISLELSNCEENFDCKIELIPNKKLEFKTDEFGVMYTIISEGEKTILKYSYIKKPTENIADDGYSEIIYAELDASIPDINLTNEALQTVKLHFGRFCFCRGNTGYFPITSGELKLTNIENNQLKIDLNFSLKKVPYKISSIQETISLKSKATN